MSMKTLLEVEIEDEITTAAGMDKGTKEHATVIDCATKMIDRLIKIEENEAAEAYNEKKLKEELKAQIIKALIDAGIKATTLLVTVILTMVCLRFEENGSLTTTAGRKIADWFLKK